MKNLEPKPQETKSELFNIEAEQAVLGTIILNNEYLNKVADFLLAEHFYEPAHQKIYNQIIHNVEKVNIIANQVTLKQFFEQEENIKILGGATYLATLLAKASAIIDISNYGKIIFDLAVKRNLVMIGEEIVIDAYKGEEKATAIEQIEVAEAKLFNLTQTGGYKKDFSNISDSLKVTLEKTLIARKRDSHISGISTGLTDLDHILSGMQPSDLIILAGRPSMGKAQPLDAKVLTISGWKKMGELKIGEELASLDGKASKISGIFPQGKKEIYEINFSDGRKTQCCDEHLWRVYYRQWDKPRVLEARKIREMLTKSRYKNRLWIDNFCGQYEEKNILEIDSWVLGALIGDGTLSGGSIRFSNANQDVLDFLQDKIKKEFLLKKAGKYDYRIVQKDGANKKGSNRVSPNKIKESLKALGLFDVVSEEKFIPQKYLNSSYKERIKLLAGLIDTDGWVEKWGSVRYSTTSKKLADDVVKLVRSLGGIASLKNKKTNYIYKEQKKSGQLSYVVNIANIGSSLPLSNKKKKERLVKFSKNKRLTITEIKSVGKKEAQCIAVTHKERLYITDDYIVTHNTALGINIAVNACKVLNKNVVSAKDKKAVGFFSLEMASDQLSARILAMETSISATKFRSGLITELEWEAIARRSAEIEKWPFFIDDTPALSIAAIRSRTRRMVRKHNLAFLVVDYLQLIKGTLGSFDNRVQEISEITQGLKAIAKEFNIPVLALSQLSRAVEQREDKRPQLSDLRESGSIEQDADIVSFIFRESYYHERKKPAESEEAKFNEWKNRMNELRNRSELIIAKQRNGPVGTVNLFFDAEFTRFGNLDSYH